MFDKCLKGLKMAKITGSKVGFAALLGCILTFSGCNQQDTPCEVTMDASIEKLEGHNNLAPVLIVGSGPAGLAAALYSARLGFKTYILEGSHPGGQLMYTSYIENYPSHSKILGSKLMEEMRKQVQGYDVTFLREDLESIDLSQWPYKIKTSDDTNITAMTVVIATGSSPRLLGAPGEKEYWSKGVSTCAVCDAAFYKGKHVLVVGGGDSAAEQALQLAVYADRVDVMVRKDKMRACKAIEREMEKVSNIHINYNKSVKKVVGDEKHVTHVMLHDSQKDSTEEYAVDGVFLAIGSDPNTKMLKGQIDLDDQGYINVIGQSQKTSKQGVYAAGDVEDYTYKQAIVASGEGAKAAIDAQRFLQETGLGPDALKQVAGRYYVPSRARAKADIMMISTLKEFDEEVAQSDIPVILDFYTKTCSTCKYMMPLYQEAAGELLGRMKFIKVDAEEAKDLAAKLQIAKVPTFLVYKKGKLVARYQRVMNRSSMMEFVKQFVD